MWNRRWLALGVAWAVCLLGWLVVALIPNSYESETRIFVQLDDVLAEQIGIGTGARARDIDRIRQTLVERGQSGKGRPLHPPGRCGVQPDANGKGHHPAGR